MPFFVLLAPVVGYAVGESRPPWIAVRLAAVMLLTSQPWLFDLQERPLLRDGKGRDVLFTSRPSLYFRLAPGLEEAYRDVASRVEQSACTSVGVMLGGDSAEYPLWPLLYAPRQSMRIEWIVAGTPSARYVDPTFQPCAVICGGSCPQIGPRFGNYLYLSSPAI
jgi:hypothetical protein